MASDHEVRGSSPLAGTVQAQATTARSVCATRASPRASSSARLGRTGSGARPVGGGYTFAYRGNGATAVAALQSGRLAELVDAHV